MKWLASLTARVPVPVFAALGRGGEATCSALACLPGLRLVSSPRQAAILLVIGEVEEERLDGLRRVHDQLPHPRATAWWRARPAFSFTGQTGSVPLTFDQKHAADLVPRLRQVQHELYRGALATEPDLGEDCPPNEWRGKGDHGQGGEGMMGGVPYGRPMAMLGEDMRDGLHLDPLAFSVGPFLPSLPPGMAARVVLQGDLIQSWEVLNQPYPQVLPAVFQRALQEDVEVAGVELARVCSHLRRLARMLELDGLTDLACRVRRFAARLQGKGLALDAAIERATALQKWLGRNGFIHLAEGIGGLSTDRSRQIGGFAARAAGAADDARNDDPVYQKLGFSPVCHQAGDLRARREQLLAEIAQALVLAKRAANLKLSARTHVESPLGALQAGRARRDNSHFLADFLPGLEWSEAVAQIASLPLQGIAFTPEEGG